MITEEEKAIAQELVEAAQDAADQTHIKSSRRVFEALAKFAAACMNDAPAPAPEFATEEKTSPGA